MKFVKLQKASIKKQAALTDEQVNYIKQQFGDEMYKYDSFENHNDLDSFFSTLQKQVTTFQDYFSPIQSYME